MARVLDSCYVDAALALTDRWIVPTIAQLHPLNPNSTSAAVVHILDAGPDANFGPAPPPYDPEMAPGPPCPGLASEPSVQQAPLLEPATVVTTITVTSPA